MMSVEIMGKVWAMDLPLPELGVLLAMADHADHHGQHIFPSLNLIAWKVGLSERQTRRIVKSLTDAKILVPEKALPGFPKEYSIDVDAAPLKPPMIVGLTQEKRTQLRARLVERDGPQCHYCGQTGTEDSGPDGRLWHLDRVDPGAYGGRYELPNLVLSCATCNQRQGPNKRKRQNPPVVHDTPVTQDTPVNMTPLSPVTPVMGDTPVTSGQTPLTFPVDTPDIAMSAKPSVEPSVLQPSEESTTPQENATHSLLPQGSDAGEASPASGKRRKLPLSQQPGVLDPNLITLILKMQRKEFHVLAEQTKLHEEFWDAQIECYTAHGVSDFGELLRDVDRYYSSHPELLIKGDKSARARMNKALEVAYDKLLKRNQPRRA